MLKITCDCGETLSFEALAENRTQITPSNDAPKPYATHEMPYNPPTAEGTFGGVSQCEINWKESFCKADRARLQLEGELEVARNKITAAEKQIGEWLRERAGLRSERDQAIAEANRRDEKWKSGLEELLKTKLEFVNLDAPNLAQHALEKWAAGLRSEVVTAKKTAEVWKMEFCRLREKIKQIQTTL